MPTQRIHTAIAQDVLSFKTLVENLQDIRERYDDDVDVQSTFAKLDALADDRFFWDQTREGIAIFAGPSFFHAYMLNQPVQARSVAADYLYTEPLQEYLQSAARYHVLVLTANEARLYEGNRFELTARSLTGNSIFNSDTDSNRRHTDLSATLTFPYAAAAPQRNESGYGVDGSMELGSFEQFLSKVDQVVLEVYTKPSGLPLIIAALPTHDRMFRGITENLLLIPEAIPLEVGMVTTDELRKKAWGLFEPYYEGQINHVIQTYRQATAHLRGADQIDQIVKDTYDGKVDTLLLEDGRVLPGEIIDRDRIEYYGDELPQDHDVLSSLGELVKRYGGEVVIVPKNKMPSSTGAAAINRF